jgi:hypothetical protein
MGFRPYSSRKGVIDGRKPAALSALEYAAAIFKQERGDRWGTIVDGRGVLVETIMHFGGIAR